MGTTMLSCTAFHQQGRLLRTIGRYNQKHVTQQQQVINPQIKFQSFGNHALIKSSPRPKVRVVVIRWNPTGSILLPRRFSTTAQPVTQANQKTERKTWSTRFRRLAFFIKYARIPFLMVSVYALGRQQGIIECSRNPRLVEDELLQSILADVGVKDRQQVKIYTSQDKPILEATKSGALQAKTIKIGNDIIRAASLYVREKIVEAVKKVRETVPGDISNEEFIKLCHKDEDFQFWTTALYRVEGEDPNVPWRYILIDTPVANAFVSEILPQRFFITSSMFDRYIRNEDELAVVLGHEMSHLILGHVSQRNTMETFLRTIEVLLLSIDPTEGLVSLGVIGGLAWMRGIVMASFSRENETEADALGCKLAAMACYDTKKGIVVMKKMHDYQSELNKATNNSQLLTLMDSHPPSLERYEKLEKLSETENPGKYEACATVYQNLRDAIWGKSKPRS